MLLLPWLLAVKKKKSKHLPLWWCLLLLWWLHQRLMPLKTPLPVPPLLLHPPQPAQLLLLPALLTLPRALQLPLAMLPKALQPLQPLRLTPPATLPRRPLTLLLLPWLQRSNSRINS